MDAIYRVDGNRVVTSPAAAGPWDISMQHGSAPAALVVWAAEAILTREPMRIARVTIDLMRPVPVAPLTIETEILREGRKIQLCAVRLLAGDAVVVGATVLKIIAQALTLPPEIADQPVELPGPDQAREEAPDFSASPFVTGISMRAPRPVRRARSRRDLVSGRPAAGRSLAGFANHAGRGRRGFLQRHLSRAGLPEMDVHQCRPHRQFCAAAGRRMDFARCRILDRS